MVFCCCLFSVYFLNMSCRGPGRNLRTVSRMLSSSSSSSSPQPLGIAFLGRVSDPSQACSMAAFSSASFSSFFLSPYWWCTKRTRDRNSYFGVRHLCRMLMSDVWNLFWNTGSSGWITTGKAQTNYSISLYCGQNHGGVKKHAHKPVTDIFTFLFLRGWSCAVADCLVRLCHPESKDCSLPVTPSNVCLALELIKDSSPVLVLVLVLVLLFVPVLL